MRDLKQSSTAQPLTFFMADSSDHITGKTGLAPTVTISKNGGSFASPAGAVTEIANGWYKVAGNATDTNTLGPLDLHASATGADPADKEWSVVAYDPQDVASLGLTGVVIESRSRFWTRAASNPTVAGQLITLTGADSDNTYLIGGTVIVYAGTGSPKALRITAATSGAGDKVTVSGAIPAFDATSKVVVLPPIGASVNLVSGNQTAADALAANIANLDAAVSSRMATFAYTAPDNATIGAIGTSLADLRTHYTNARGDKLDNLDTSITSRMATFVYTAPDNATVGGINTTLNALRADYTNARAAKLDNLDASITSRMATFAYIAPDNAGVASIKTITDHLATALETVGGGVYRYTAAALAQAPAGGGGGGGAAGSGSDQVTITWTNSDTGLPVADGDVWITSDAGGANVVAGTLQTDSQGHVKFLLDAGVTYYFWAQKDGVNPVLGRQFTAAAD